MPAAKYTSILAVGPLAAGASVVVPHGLTNGLQGLIPNDVMPDRVTAIKVTARDATGVTFMNTGNGQAAAVFFRALFWHSVEKDALTLELGPLPDGIGGLDWQGDAGGAVQHIKDLPVNVDIWVNQDIGIDTNPGTQASPVKTFDQGMLLAPPMYRGYCRVHFVEPLLPWFTPLPPGVASNGYNVAPGGFPGFVPIPTRITVLPRPLGDGVFQTGTPGFVSTPIAWIAESVQNPGTSYSNRSAIGSTVLQAVAAPVTAHSFATVAVVSPFHNGSTIRFTSGALNGSRFIVRSSDSVANTVTVFDDVSAAAPGDTFYYEGPAVQFLLGDNSNWLITSYGGRSPTGDLTLIGIAFAGGGYVFLGGAPVATFGFSFNLSFSGCTVGCGGVLVSTGQQTFVNNNASLVAGIAQLSAFQDPVLFPPLFAPGNRPLQGLVCNACFQGVVLIDSASLEANEYVGTGRASLFINGPMSYARLGIFQIIDSSFISVVSQGVLDAKLGNYTFPDFTNPSQINGFSAFGLTVLNGAIAYVDGIDFKSSGGFINAAIQAALGGKVYCDHTSGLLLSGHGVWVSGDSYVHCVAANRMLVTGPLGDIRMGMVGSTGIGGSTFPYPVPSGSNADEQQGIRCNSSRFETSF